MIPPAFTLPDVTKVGGLPRQKALVTVGEEVLCQCARETEAARLGEEGEESERFWRQRVSSVHLGLAAPAPHLKADGAAVLLRKI